MKRIEVDLDSFNTDLLQALINADQWDEDHNNWSWHLHIEFDEVAINDGYRFCISHEWFPRGYFSQFFATIDEAKDAGAKLLLRCINDPTVFWQLADDNDNKVLH